MTDPSGYSDYDFVADLYDHVTPYGERADVAFWVEAAREAGGEVLEVGCGTGRVLIPTARAGIEITGLDLSPQMLRVCREKLGREPHEVRARARLVQADMRRFDLGRRFALITSPFRPFQHLITVEDQKACLGCVRQHLVDGGRFILDLFEPSIPYLADSSKLKEYGDEPEFTMSDGRRVLRRFRIAGRNYSEQVQDVELIYDVTHPDGRRERLVHRFPMRYLFRYEVEHLLARCGLALETVYGDYDKNPFGSKYPGEIIAVARRA